MSSLADFPTHFPAGVLERTEKLSVHEIPQWPLEDYDDPDLMLIRVEACGVCGSDLRYFAGENPWAQNVLGRFVPNPPNIVLGHEYAGIVVKVLSSANEHWLGKRVAPICSKVCGACMDCREGRSHLCERTVHLGHGQGWGQRDYYPGAYGRYAPAWGAECFVLPDSVTFEQGAMMDILAVGVHASRVGGPAIGRPILVIGAGPAGSAIAQAALAFGATDAVFVDPSPVARGIAARQGYTNVFDSFQDNAIKALGGFGAVFDCVCTESTVDFGLTHLGKAGTMVQMALHAHPIRIDPLKLGSERRLVNSCNFERADFAQALEWLAEGKLRVDEWFSRIALENAPALFEAAIREGKSAFKWLIVPAK